MHSSTPIVKWGMMTGSLRTQRPGLEPLTLGEAEIDYFKFTTRRVSRSIACQTGRMASVNYEALLSSRHQAMSPLTDSEEPLR